MSTHFDGRTREIARLLLDAAKKAGYPPESVRSDSTGFTVPDEVAKALGPQEGETVKVTEETEKKAAPKRRRRTTTKSD